MGFLPWEIRAAFPGECQLRQSRAPQTTVHAGCFKYFHNPPNSDIDYGIFNVRTVVNTFDCTRGHTDTVRESALKVDSGRKIPCRSGESNLRQRRAGPMLYHLSYVHVPPPHPMVTEDQCSVFVFSIRFYLQTFAYNACGVVNTF